MVIFIEKFVIFSFVFIGVNVLEAFHISANSFYVMLLVLSIISSVNSRYNWFKNFRFVILYYFVILFASYRLFTDRGEGTRSMMLAIIGAPILFAALPNFKRNFDLKQQSFWEYVVKILLIGYLVEVLIAFIERMSGSLIFGWQGNIFYTGYGGFRSTALYGHPLGNALIVTTAMSFILVSNLKPKLKMFLWGIGFVSIFCFNSRSSIVGNVLLLITFTLHTIFLKKHVKFSIKIFVFVTLIFTFCMIYVLLFYFGWGNRLLSFGLFDDSSSQVRVDAWNLFIHYDIESFLFPHTFIEGSYMKWVTGVYRLENPWLGLMLFQGLLFLGVYIVLYFIFIKYLLKDYGKFEKYFISVSYLMIASTNNSFDTTFDSVFYFLLLCVVFNPKLFQKIVLKKHLN